MDETVLLFEDKVYKWDGPKRKQTIFSGKIGRLVLTDRRLLFLSSGSTGAGTAMAAGMGLGALGVFVEKSTSGLDESAVSNEGGLSLPLGSVRADIAGGMFKWLLISWNDATGSHQASLAPKNGPVRNMPDWVARINAALPHA